VNHVSVATPVCDVRFTLHKQTFSTPSRSDLRLGASAGQFRTASSASAAKRGELLLQLVWREADAFTGFPTKVFTSVERFSRARSWNDRGRFANAAGLARNVPCPWRDRSCRENQRRPDGTSLRTRDVPPLCCVRLSCHFSLLAEEYRPSSNRLNSGRTECQ
jgi:hypothetical protein